MNTKRCTKCDQDKPISEWNKNKRTSDGLGTVCKECNKAYLKEHYKNNREYYLSKSAERKRKLKTWFAEYKSKLWCSKCGENHPACLDFHHVNADDKDLDISLTIQNNWSIEHVKEEIEKCIVLCSNCHRKLHYETMTLGVIG